MIISLANRLGGVKTYYFVQKLEQIRGMVADGKDVINFGIGSPDMAPADEAVKELYDAAQRQDTHGYQPYKGVQELRSAIANYYQQTYHVNIDASSEVLPLMGSKEGILHLTLAFLNEGDIALVPNPGYPTYTSLTKLLGASVRTYDLKKEQGWYPNIEEIEKEDLSNVKIMWINYPHMPTGTPARAEVFEEIVAFAKRNNILICHDNPYSRVLNQQEPISIFSVEGAKEVAVELNSLSKSHNMAGWRVGMLLGAQEYVNAALKVKSNIDSGMFYGLQSAAIKAMELEDSWHEIRNDQYKERRDWVFKILDHLGFEYEKDQEGMFVWAKPDNNSPIKDIPAFIDRVLQEKHIFFTPGMIFGSNGDNYIRLSLCVPASRMEEAYNRLLSL